MACHIISNRAGAHNNLIFGYKNSGLGYIDLFAAAELYSIKKIEK